MRRAVRFGITCVQVGIVIALGFGITSWMCAQVESAVQALDTAEVSYVDRWLVSGQLPEGAKQVRMANYMSIGCDAKAALLWARMARGEL